MQIHIPRSTRQITAYLMSKGGSLGRNPGPSSRFWIALSKSVFTSSACKIQRSTQFCVSVCKPVFTNKAYVTLTYFSNYCSFVFKNKTKQNRKPLTYSQSCLTKYKSNWIKLTGFYSLLIVILSYRVARWLSG